MIINKNTGISLGLLVSLLGVGAWLASIAFDTKANGKSIEELQSKNSQDEAFKREVLDRLIRIEDKINK